MPWNGGKPYTKASLVRIKNLVNHGVPIQRIAVIMERSVGAISLIIRDFRRMEMMLHGNDYDTLKTWKPSINQ